MSTPIEEYEDILERIISVYLDATEGFGFMARSGEIIISPSAPKIRIRDDRGVSPPRYLIFALGTPEGGNYMELSARRGEDIVANNQDDGPNFNFMGCMCIVAAYQYWDDHYRARIAEFLGIQKEELKIPNFGDSVGASFTTRHDGQTNSASWSVLLGQKSRDLTSQTAFTFPAVSSSPCGGRCVLRLRN